VVFGAEFPHLAMLAVVAVPQARDRVSSRFGGGAFEDLNLAPTEDHVFSIDLLWFVFNVPFSEPIRSSPLLRMNRNSV
jgi:hypothetical protein